MFAPTLVQVQTIDFDTALHRASRGRLIHSDFGLFVPVTRHGQEVTVQFRHEDRSLRAKPTRDLAQGRIYSGQHRPV